MNPAAQVIGTLILISCTSTSASDQVGPRPLAGRYSWGDDPGPYISLELMDSERYRAASTGCMAIYGKAEGR